MRNIILSWAAGFAFVTAALAPLPARSQVVCTPTSNIQCNLDLQINFVPGNVEITVPTDTVDIPANSLIEGSIITIDVPITNSGLFNVINGTFTITGLPAYVTIPPPATFSIPAGAQTTVSLLATVGAVPTNAAPETADVLIAVDGDITGGSTSFSF